MADVQKNTPISERSLEDLFPDVASFPLCVNIDKGTEIWVAAGMLVEYLESFTDAIVVRENYKPIGLVGGYDLLDNLRKNPTNDFFSSKQSRGYYDERSPNCYNKNPVRHNDKGLERVRTSICSYSK